jgi:hypothetical protein
MCTHVSPGQGDLARIPVEFITSKKHTSDQDSNISKNVTKWIKITLKLNFQEYFIL